MPTLHLKISSKLNNKVAKIYHEASYWVQELSYQAPESFAVYIYDKPPKNPYDPSSSAATLLADLGVGQVHIHTYFVDNEVEAIELAQLALSA